MGNFLRDLAESQKAVDLVMDALLEDGYSALELNGRENQKLGDVVFLDKETGSNVYLEVKYDKMSRRTGNLCFEVANDRGKTGICKTGACRIAYVCPLKNGCHKVYVFNTVALREYLFNPNNSSKVRITYGGDDNRFMLCLVKKHNIENDQVYDEVWTLDA